MAALLLLGLMGVLMAASVWDDTLTFDEEPHIAGGYTYLTQRTYDLNPEHPPLMKDLSALPLLFMSLDTSWLTGNWFEIESWEVGRKLIFESGGDAGKILFAARMPIIAFTLALGWIVFSWTSAHYGAAAGLLALFLYAFSPTFLAHGRYVTTDAGAAAGFFIATIAYLRFLRAPTRNNVYLAGLALGFALLTKYSTFLLIPIFIVLAIAWKLLHPIEASEIRPAAKIRRRRFCVRRAGDALLIALPWPRRKRPLPVSSPRVTGGSIAAMILMAFVVIYPVYLQHTWSFPPERQATKAQASLLGRGVGNTPKDIVQWASDKPLLRPWAQYLTGMLQTLIRSAGSNEPYFLGEIHTSGVRAYFPAVYLLKEPIALHVLTLVAILSVFVGALMRRGLPRNWRQWAQENFTECAMLFVVAVYWLVSIRSNLNIGVRHLLPVLPFTFVLVAREVRALALGLKEKFARHAALVILGYAGLVGGLLVWQAAGVLRAHPSYLSYFNELAGGPENGWQRVVDSNADWGQDLKRLTQFVEERGIPKIALDYFGAADPTFYLPGKWEPHNSCMEPRHGWIAVSVHWYQESRRKPECDYRRWLKLDQLEAKVSYSILIFHIE